MSDVEHELITDLGEIRDEVDELRALARRALQAASAAQDAAYGRHDAWIAKLRGEGVTFLEGEHKLGDTRAVMIEGPSREAIELVET